MLNRLRDVPLELLSIADRRLRPEMVHLELSQLALRKADLNRVVVGQREVK